MIRLLAKVFVKGSDEKQIRQSYAMMCGFTGIVLNALLFAGKLAAGSISHSIAITADAFNNLSDAGSSIVTLIGFKLAGTKPDPGHPFGHGRIEYVSGLIVSGIILIMAFELIKDSISKIFHPQDMECSILVICVLVASILVKLYMFTYNQLIAKKINSAAMKATAIDSLSDSVATLFVMFSTLFAKYTGISIDGYCGVLVGIFILFAGIGAAKETLNPLLGQPPTQEFVDRVESLVKEEENIRGVHDLVVHDYGPGRVMISLHAEVPADGDLLELHELIDHIEKKLGRELECEAVIHMDPVVTNDPETDHLKALECSILASIDEKITLHDFRVVKGPTHTNIIYDIVIPYDYEIGDEKLVQILEQKTRESIGDKYSLVVKVDKESSV